MECVECGFIVRIGEFGLGLETRELGRSAGRVGVGAWGGGLKTRELVVS